MLIYRLTLPTIHIDMAESVKLPIRPDSFSYCDLFIAPTCSFSSYPPDDQENCHEPDYRYGVAAYNVNTGLATDISDRGWYAETDSKVTFPNLFGAHSSLPRTERLSRKQVRMHSGLTPAEASRL